MSKSQLQLIERLIRIVADRGDVELMMSFDRIMDRDTEEEQFGALAAVVKKINEQKKTSKGTS